MKNSFPQRNLNGLFCQNKISMRLLHNNFLIIPGEVFLCNFNTMKISNRSVFISYPELLCFHKSTKTN